MSNFIVKKLHFTEILPGLWDKKPAICYQRIQMLGDGITRSMDSDFEIISVNQGANLVGNFQTGDNYILSAISADILYRDDRNYSGSLAAIKYKFDNRVWLRNVPNYTKPEEFIAQKFYPMPSNSEYLVTDGYFHVGGLESVLFFAFKFQFYVHHDVVLNFILMPDSDGGSQNYDKKNILFDLGSR